MKQHPKWIILDFGDTSSNMLQCKLDKISIEKVEAGADKISKYVLTNR